MAKVTATTSWQNVAITADEVWRANGPVLVGTASEPSTDDDALPLAAGESIGFQSGVTVYYKSSTDVGATIVRIGVSA
jgi:hypothetical protein